MTQRSLKRYKLLGPSSPTCWIASRSLPCRRAPDAERIIALGARKARVVVAGNTKFDLAADLSAAREASRGLAPRTWAGAKICR